ncbi:MAG: MFS transporter [Deferrisomatales bacterium]|nr:MFS transporter [Deferrisomatales bacterium]
MEAPAIGRASPPEGTPQGGTAPAFRPFLRPLLLLTGIFTLNFVSRVVLAPLLPAIERDLSIGHAAAGGLFFFISMGYCVGLLTSGSVSARLTHRRTVALSSVAVGAALCLIALSNGLLGIRGGMTLLGAAAGLYLPSGVATITNLVPTATWGRALAIHELAPNLSFAAAPLLAEALLAWMPWRGCLVAIGLVAMSWGALYLRFGSGGSFPGAPSNWRSLRPLLRQRPFWVLMALFTLALGMSLGVYAMLPLYLVAELEFARPAANSLVAASRLSGLVMLFASGWLADRLGARRTLMLVFSATGALTVLLGVLPAPWVLPVVLLQPTLVVCFFPVGFAALSQLGPQAVAFVVPLAILAGAGGVPAAMGWIATQSGFAAAMVSVGALTLAGVLVARGLPRHAGGGGS